MHRKTSFVLLAPLALGLACKASGKKDDSGKKSTTSNEEHSFDAEATEAFGQTIEITNAEGSIKQPVVEDDEEEDLKDVLDQCGVDDLSDPDRETFSTVMKYDYLRLINAGIAVAKVPLTGILDLRGTLAETTLNVGVEVGEVAGEDLVGPVADVTPIKNRADELSALFRGPATAYSVPQNSNFHKAWKGVLCTITAAERLKNLRSGHTTETTFVPPFPPNISPIAEKQRYEKEIGQFRYFHEITATIQSTDHPLFTAGQELIGNVLVEKIPSRKVTPHGVVQGDVAYRISNRFGSEEETLALGFHIWTEYYIDVERHTFSAVIANVGDEETMHFIGEYTGAGGE
jgi:hypothetical protein